MYSQVKRKKTQHIPTSHEIWTNFLLFDLHWPGLEQVLDTVLYRPNSVQVSNALSFRGKNNKHSHWHILSQFRREPSTNSVIKKYIDLFLNMINRNEEFNKNHSFIEKIFKIYNENPRFEIIIDLILEVTPFAVTLGKDIFATIGPPREYVFRKLVTIPQGIGCSVHSLSNYLPLDNPDLVIQFGRKLFKIGQKPNLLPWYIRNVFCTGRQCNHKCYHRYLHYDIRIVKLWLEKYKYREYEYEIFFDYVCFAFQEHRRNSIQLSFEDAFETLKLLIEFGSNTVKWGTIAHSINTLCTDKADITECVFQYFMNVEIANANFIKKFVEYVTVEMLKVYMENSDEQSFKFLALGAVQLLETLVCNNRQDLLVFIFDRLNYDYFYSTLEQAKPNLRLNIFTSNQKFYEELENRIPDVHAVLLL